MPSQDTPSSRSFIEEVEALLGRPLNPDEARLAGRLATEKTAAVVARELEAAVITDPEKIRPEHSDAANE